MRRLGLLLPIILLTGCPQDPPPPPPATPSPAASTSKQPVEEAAPSPEPSAPTPEPEPEPDPEPEATPEPSPSPSPTKSRKPMNLLARTKVKLEEVDPAALKKQPKRVSDRTEEAERRAESTGRSAWGGGKKRPRPAQPTAAPRPRSGKIEKAQPIGVNREILRTWSSAGQALSARSWNAYAKLHTPAAQKAMLAYVIRRTFSYGLQRSEEFAARNLEPPKFKQVREQLQRFGVRSNTLRLKRAKTGSKPSWAPPDHDACVRQIPNVLGAYTKLMANRNFAGGQGTHRGLYWPGDLANLEVRGNQAQALVLERNGQARFAVAFAKQGRDWLLAGRQQLRR